MMMAKKGRKKERYNDHRETLSNSHTITELQEINTALFKKYSSLRASKTTMEATVAALREQLQDSTSASESLLAEKRELEEKLESLRSEMKEKTLAFLASEDCSPATMEATEHAALAEEAPRLKAVAESLAIQKQHLTAELVSVLLEKTSLEDLVNNIRSGEEALRKDLKQMITLADRLRMFGGEKVVFERETLSLKTMLHEANAQSKAIKAETIELENTNKKLYEELAKVRVDKSTTEKQAADLRSHLLAMESELKSEKEKILLENFISMKRRIACRTLFFKRKRSFLQRWKLRIEDAGFVPANWKQLFLL